MRGHFIEVGERSEPYKHYPIDERLKENLKGETILCSSLRRHWHFMPICTDFLSE